MKTCTRCLIEKPASEFNKQSANKDGLSYRCRSCTKELYYEKHEHNKETMRRRARDQYEKRREYVASTADRSRELSKVRYKKNREKILRTAKEKYRTEKYTASRLVYYQNNKQRIKQRNKEYAKNNPDKGRQKSARRRVREKENISYGPDAPTLKKLLERDGSSCYYCGCVLDLAPRTRGGSVAKNAVEIDHKIPISRGGRHSLENTVLACRKCNGEKSAKTDEEYLKYKEIQKNIDEK